MICKLIKKLLCPNLYEEERAIGKYKNHLKKYGKVEYVDINIYNFIFMGHKIVREYNINDCYNGVYCPCYIGFVDNVCIWESNEREDCEALYDLAVKMQENKLHKVNKLYWEQQELWDKLPEWYRERNENKFKEEN